MSNVNELRDRVTAEYPDGVKMGRAMNQILREQLKEAKYNQEHIAGLYLSLVVSLSEPEAQLFRMMTWKDILVEANSAWSTLKEVKR